MNRSLSLLFTNRKDGKIMIINIIINQFIPLEVLEWAERQAEIADRVRATSSKLIELSVELHQEFPSASDL